MTKKEAIKALRESDHCFISADGVYDLTKPFGFEGSTYVAKANPQDFKGLTLWDNDGKPVKEMEGQDASVIATEIANHLGLEYKEQFGRGSQLRTACNAIEKAIA